MKPIPLGSRLTKMQAKVLKRLREAALSPSEVQAADIAWGKLSQLNGKDKAVLLMLISKALRDAALVEGANAKAEPPEWHSSGSVGGDAEGHKRMSDTERPSLRCARAMHRLPAGMSQTEQELAGFITKHTGCDELLEACKAVRAAYPSFAHHVSLPCREQVHAAIDKAEPPASEPKE